MSVEMYSRRDVIVFEQVTEDVTRQTKGSTSIKWLPETPANFIHTDLDRAQSAW